MQLTKLLKWDKYNSIRKTFIIPFIVPLLIILIILTLLILKGTHQVSQLAIETVSEQVFIQVDELLNHHLDEAVQLNALNVQNYRMGLLNFEDDSIRERYFSSAISVYPEVTMTFVGLPDKRFYGARRSVGNDVEIVKNDTTTDGASEYYQIDANGRATSLTDRFEKFDPTSRPWYIKASDNGGPIFSDVYNHFIYKLPTITASYPVFIEGELKCVFGVDYLLTWLGKTLSTLPVRENGLVFITDEQGQMIASSRSSDDIFEMVSGESKLIKAVESDDQLINSAAKLVASGDKGDVSINGIDYYIEVQAFEMNNLKWEVFVLLSKTDVLSELNMAVSQTFVVVFISFIVFIIIAWLLSSWITKPILNLNSSAKRLSEGKFEFVGDERRKDELGQLSRSFNEMAIKLTNVVATLEKQVSERTRDLKETNESLSRLSFSDGLTGLPNRRKFDAFYHDAYEENMKRKRHMAVIIMDLDDFKAFNDTFGHLAGDDCLRQVGSKLSAAITLKKDLVARFGGEEFSAVLQGYSKQEVMDLCELIRREIESIEILIDPLTSSKITVSIGAAYFVPTTHEEKDEWVKKADAALYDAKHGGKNQTQITG
jgi:diguanylate cyclase (GGDEF)-like protein